MTAQDETPVGEVQRRELRALNALAERYRVGPERIDTAMSGPHGYGALSAVVHVIAEDHVSCELRHCITCIGIRLGIATMIANIRAPETERY